MAWFKVWKGGTATGDGGRSATQPTGGFAALAATAYYDSIKDAVENSTTPPTVGDDIIVSDIHAGGGVTAVQWTFPVVTLPGPRIISVDHTDMEVFKAGASEIASAGQDFIPAGANDIGLETFGFTFYVGDDFRISKIGSVLMVNGGGVVFDGSSDRVLFSAAGARLQMNDATISYSAGSTGSCITGTNGPRAVFNNCVFDGGSSDIDSLIGGTSATGGGVFFAFNGCDLTDVSEYICEGFGSAITEDALEVTLKNCKLSATLIDFSSEVFTKKDQKLGVYNSSDVSAQAEYQWFELTGGGRAEHVTGVYRNESIAFPSGTKVSVECITTATVEDINSQSVQLTQWAELSGANQSIEVYLTSDSALTNQDIWVDVTYRDGTNKQTPNKLTSGNDGDPYATGVTLTTDATSTWTGGKTNKYKIVIDTSVDPGADQVPIVTVNIKGQSKTIYVDRVIGLVA